MKPKVFAALFVGATLVVTVANVTVGAGANPFGEGKQIFNVAQRIEQDDWAKASVPIVMHNHFASSQLVSAGSRGDVSFEFEEVVTKMFDQPLPDKSQPFVELSGTDGAKAILNSAKWKGTVLCTGDGIRQCEAYMLWPDDAEGQSNVVMVAVHLGNGQWGFVEQKQLADMLAAIAAGIVE